MEEKKQEEIDIIVNQLIEWQKANEKRAVMVVAVEKIDDDKSSLTAVLRGTDKLLLPALTDLQKNENWHRLSFCSLLLSKSLP